MVDLDAVNGTSISLMHTAHPSSSRAIEILIPLGVCAVYRMMFGRDILNLRMLYEEKVERMCKKTQSKATWRGIYLKLIPGVEVIAIPQAPHFDF